MAHVDRLLDPRTRLVSFLGSLAFSMTCGAAILHWIEPADRATDARSAMLASSREALREAVATNAPLRPGRWQTILVEPRQLQLGVTDRVLAARPERRDFHFVVDPAGRIEPTTSWHHQQSVGGTPKTIRICIAGSRVEDLPSRDQWRSLLGLLDTLRRECRIPSRHVELAGESAAGDPTVKSARDRLRQRLLAAGILG